MDVRFLSMAGTPTEQRNLGLVSSSDFFQIGVAPSRKWASPQGTDKGHAAEMKMQNWCSFAQQEWPFVHVEDGIAPLLHFGQFLRP